MCSFFAFNLEKFTPDRNFYTGSARGARDNYEVCQAGSATVLHKPQFWILNLQSSILQICPQSSVMKTSHFCCRNCKNSFWPQIVEHDTLRIKSAARTSRKLCQPRIQLVQLVLQEDTRGKYVAPM